MRRWENSDQPALETPDERTTTIAPRSAGRCPGVLSRRAGRGSADVARCAGGGEACARTAWPAALPQDVLPDDGLSRQRVRARGGAGVGARRAVVALAIALSCLTATP